MKQNNFILRAWVNMELEIPSGFTFYGFIPKDSNEQHLGIVLGVKDTLLKYCYCTSKEKYKNIKFRETDYVKIPAHMMEKYFNNPQETFIYISQQHIIDIPLITFQSRLSSFEYEEKERIDNGIFSAILSKINNSDNLSERFKQEFFEFLEID